MKKKYIAFGLIGVFAMVLVSAALVSYISNTITGDIDVDSPIEIEIIAVDGRNSQFDNGVNPSTYSVDVYGGESFDVDTITHILVNGVTGHISEHKIVGFNGEGITLTYTDTRWSGDLPLCTTGTDTYFYIGSPDDILDIQDLESTTTFTAALNLDPTQALTVESRVILVGDMKCT